MPQKMCTDVHQVHKGNTTYMVYGDPRVKFAGINQFCGEVVRSTTELIRSGLNHALITLTSTELHRVSIRKCNEIALIQYLQKLAVPASPLQIPPIIDIHDESLHPPPSC